VPIGNLPADYKTFVSDVFFARALKHENHLLWVSSSALPDLGGTEEDDNRLMMDGDADTVPRINNAGVYPYVCVEVDIHALAVSTILQSSHVNDIEGVGGSTIAFDSLGQSSLEDMIGTNVGGSRVRVTDRVGV
jgi:DNA polymerase epsilon subunit 1